MSGLRKRYPFDLLEKKWQDKWLSEGTFRAWNPGDALPEHHPFAIRHGLKGLVHSSDLPPKYYILDMFPYPSGAGLHVGHPEGYTATDILARYKRAQGFNVLHPMGWDAFGLPAEQFAIKTGQHPRVTTEQNIDNFRRQIQAIGFSYDWSREVDTTNPGYYRWTQWIFLQLYHAWFNPGTNKAESIDTLEIPENLSTEEDRRTYIDQHRLAYVAEAPVNWCPELGTVLANEEVIDGRSEVGGFPVVRRPMRQWMLRITAYAQRLLDDLNTLEWSHSLKEMQRNWIGRSEGAEVDFRIENSDETIRVFTTRPDTLFGATYMVLSPEHGLVDQITTEECRQAIMNYVNGASKKSDLERTELAREKTGEFTGRYAINPVNGNRIPIWIADYVLASYGTGAIMAVPGHDTRDLEFAQKFNLPIVQVVQAPEGQESIGFTGEGVSVASDFLNGLPTTEAKARIIDWLESKKLGYRTINFKLRDWLFSRQRYWGEPFPIVWKDGLHEAIPESDLPLNPPELSDFKPTGSGDPPLARAKDWVQLENGFMRETNTMPQWAGSCWYYLRYLDAQNQEAFCGNESESYWMGTAFNKDTSVVVPKPGIDLYVGGAEHAVLHLLYARFWHKVLFDLGHVSTPEPFFKLVNQGIILGEDGQKMSKSRGNVVNPDEIIAEYGADAFRLYEMFMGPLEMSKPWNTQGVEGVYRFLSRIWRLYVDASSQVTFEESQAMEEQTSRADLNSIALSPDVRDTEPTGDQTKCLHICIKKVSEDLDHMRFNTAISALMIFLNEAVKWEIKPVAIMRPFLRLLQPFAPHLAEELNEKINHRFDDHALDLAYLPWPEYDESLLVEHTVEIPVQINGRVRDRLVIPVEATKETMESEAMKSERIQSMLEGKIIRKVIIVPGRLVNIVVTENG